MRKFGVELENNTTTPMEAVVEMLVSVFGWSARLAFEKTLGVHQRGRALVAILPEDQRAQTRKRLVDFSSNMEHPVSF